MAPLPSPTMPPFYSPQIKHRQPNHPHSDFKTFGFWTKNPTLLSRNLGLQIFTTRISIVFSKKLQRIKTGLKSWAKTKYRHTTNKLQCNEEKIRELQEKLWHQPCNDILIKHINRLILQREKLLLFIQRAWGSTARKTWLTQGDHNSRYFHNKMKAVRTHSHIFRLKNDVGQWVDSNDNLTKFLSKSFKERFTTTIPDSRMLDLTFLTPFFSPCDSQLLLALVSTDEIKNALFDINPNKSPGLDGYGAKFFQAYWPIIENDVVIAIQSFFHHRKLPPSLNHTLIALIPKRPLPETPDHYRPIGLINNTIYKGISKILVNRLRPILQREISPFQNAFTQDRSIHDNLLIAQEALNTFNKSENKTGWCSIRCHF